MNKVGIFAGSLLVAFVATYFYSPILGSNADDRAGAPFKATLNVEGVVGIRADVSELNLSSSAGTFVSAPVNVDVASNSIYGYTLSIEDADNNTNMVSTEVSDVVSSSFSGSKTSSTMADNNWGYSINNTDFYAVPASGSPVAVKRTNTIMSTAYETTPVYFGVKVGMNLPASTYADIVKFTAYVNGSDREPIDKDPNVDDNPKITMHRISNMQDMRPTICANSSIGDATILTDTRDNRSYTVKKLADGHCWMTESLGIVNKTITPADSNVTSNFTIPANDISAFTNAYNTNAAYVYYQNYYGAYYSFYTATAGWGTDGVTTGNSPTDICPRGWRLPTGNSSGEFKTLYDNYNSSELMQGAPNFKISGYVRDATLGELNTGNYWSSSSDGEHLAFYLYLNSNSSIAGPSFLNDKYVGLHVRCIAK